MNGKLPIDSLMEIIAEQDQTYQMEICKRMFEDMGLSALYTMRPYLQECIDELEPDEPIEHTLPDIRVDLIRDDRLLEGLND